MVIPQRAMRLLSSRAFNWLTRILLGLKYKDTQCGAKIFKASAWKTILPNVGTTRFAFDVDILYQLKRHQYAVLEEPTVWKDIEGSKVRFFNSSLDMFLAIVRMRLMYSPLKFIVPLYERFFSRIVEFLRCDELFCHASMLFMASMVANVCNVGYQMVVSRALPAAEYALLVTFLALFGIVARPLGALGAAIVRFTSILCKEGRIGAVRRLLLKWVALAGIPAIVLSLLGIIFAKDLAEFFHLNRVEPVIVSALALPILFIAPVLGSALRGMERFGWVSLISSTNGIARFLLGAGFVILIFPASGWALAGHVGAMYATGVISAIILVGLLRKCKPDAGPLPSLKFYIIQCFIIQLCAAVLVTGDVILVKHYLPNEVEFAYAATLGRMVVFMVVSVISAMFPKVSSPGEFTNEQRRVYFRSLSYSAVIMVCSVACCTLFPEQMLRLLFEIESPSDHLIGLTRGMSVLMALSALMNINISLLLAQKRFKLAAVTIPSAVIYMVGAYFNHDSVSVVLMWAGVSIMLSLSVTLIGIFRTKPAEGCHV